MKEFLNLLSEFLPIKKRKPSKKELKEADIYGGSDWEDWLDYERNENVPSFDKGGHKERSLANDPKHKKHWKKRK